MNNKKQSSVEDLAFFKNNAEENYITTPISVLKYITELEEHIEIIKRQLPSDKEIWEWAKMQSLIEPTGAEEFGRVYGAKWMRDKILGGNK